MAMHLSNVLSQSAEKFGNYPCIACLRDDGTVGVVTYQQASILSERHERWIQHQVVGGGNTPFDFVVAFLSSNSADYLLALLACMGIPQINNNNVLPALLNTRWTPKEMADALQSKGRHSFSKTLILYGPGFDRVAKQVAALLNHDALAVALPQYGQTALMKNYEINNYASTNQTDVSQQQVHEDWVNGTTSNAINNTNDENDSENDDAVICFTSGTTSGAKGVRLSHASLIIQAMAKLSSPCGYSRETNMLATTVPLFHVGGLSSTLALLLAGGCWVFNNSSNTNNFDPTNVLESLSHPITATLTVNTLVVVPAMLQSIFQTIPTDKVYEGVRLILIGGQSASETMRSRLSRFFPNARVVQTYACTEAASSLTFLDCNNRSNTSKHKSINSASSSSGTTVPAGDCVGVPPSHVDICLFEQQKDERGGTVPTSRITQPFQVGIIATRGSHVMNGYWQRGEKQERLSRTAWFLTNDLGYWDDHGRLYFCGRVKDVIRTGGETVLAAQVEKILLQHENIQECAVFGLPHDKYGEAVCAAIVNETALSINLAQVKEFCACHGLAGYKHPKRLFLVKQLPRNSSGKIQKHLLRERFSTQQPILQSKL